MILDQINEFDKREVDFVNFVNGKPNGLFFILKHLFNEILDKDREVLNLGSYTGRDLDYLLPICKPIKKKIECVDSLVPINDSIKTQLQKEIMDRYSDPLITWTWEDGHDSKTIRSADFTYFSTSYDFPIEDYILSTNHPACWAAIQPTWLYPKLGQALFYKQLFILCVCNGYTIITNDAEIKEKFISDIPKMNSKLASVKQTISRKDDISYLKAVDNSADGMESQWKFINNISL